MSSCLSQIHRPLLLNEEDIFSCLILNYSLIILFFVCLNVVILRFPYLPHLEQPDDQRGHQGFLLQQAQLQQLQPLQPGQPCHQLLCCPLRAPAPLPPPTCKTDSSSTRPVCCGMYNVHSHRSMSRNWRTIVKQAMLIKLYLRPC